MARYQLLESMLEGHILAFAKGINWHIAERVKVKLTDMRPSHYIRHKGAKMQAFNLSFTANTFLPYSIGLGKGASHGFGIISRFPKTAHGNTITQ